MLPQWPRITWISSKSNPDSPGTGYTQPRILGINPWIYDFAAYNLWSRPAGLLACLEMLRWSGARTALLDCLERSWRDIAWPRPKPFGQGPLPKTEVPAPEPLRHVPRRFSRYGLPVEAVRGALEALDPAPDLVLLTSLMTYWYPGCAEAARMVRSIWPKTPIVLGGVYATACREHAEGLGLFDLVLPGPLEREDTWRAVWSLLGSEPPALPETAGFTFLREAYAEPAYSFMLGSRGCPLSCPYCASRVLYPGFARPEPEAVLEEAARDSRRGVQDFAFFDDALLLAPETWLEPFLGSLAASQTSVRLHTPNALHVRALDRKTAGLLRSAGLRTVRLGLETAEFGARPDAKLTREEWREGLGNLLDAGFDRQQIGAYILFGTPGQDPAEVEAAIAFARSFGIRPHLASYSPIPGSELFPYAEARSPYPLRDEPLFQNNAIWPCVPGGFSWETRRRFKALLNGAAEGPRHPVAGSSRA